MVDQQAERERLRQQVEQQVDHLRDAAAAFLAGRADPARLRGWAGRLRPFDRALWREAADLGWTGASLPEALGGAGLSLREALALCEVAGEHLLAEPLVAAALMPGVLIAAAGDGPLARELAASLLGGRRQVTLAWQEQAGQLDLPQPTCRWRDGKLSGSKVFVPACDDDAELLVWAMGDAGPVWLALDAESTANPTAGRAGVSITRAAAGLASVATVTFDQVELADARVLLRGEPARQALSAALAAGRLGLSAELIGAASACLARTLDHVRSRVQFDRALGSFQVVQHRCVDLHLAVELARASFQEALARLDAHAGDWFAAPVDAAICAAKARASDSATRVSREAVQLHGAMGYCDEVDIGLYLRLSLHAAAMLGGPVALRRRRVQGVAALRERENGHG